MSQAACRAGVLALAALFSTTASASSGCGSAPQGIDVVAGTWGPADVPLFALSPTGAVTRHGFDGRKRAVLATHGFRSGYGSSDLSADGRWLLYHGQRKGRQEYWLFDTRTGRDRLLMTRPLWDHGVATLSPDGRRAALYSNHDSRSPDLAGAGLHLIDLESATARHVGLPPPGSPSVAETFGSPYWSTSGELYLRLVQGDASFHVAADGTFRRVTSRHEKNARRPTFVDRGRRVELADETRMQSERGAMTSVSPDGRRTASIDENTYVLDVREGKAAPHRVAKGSYNQCEGITILLHGWPSERYFVFSSGWSEFYLHDVEQRRTRRLFGVDGPKGGFFWAAAPRR